MMMVRGIEVYRWPGYDDEKPGMPIIGIDE